MLCLIPATAARAEAVSDCNQSGDAQARLQACSDVIAGQAYNPEQKALAYRNRGNARADAGAGSQAVADFTEAIRLQPGEAGGYAGRGRAKLVVQDVDGAITDYSEALNLAPGNASYHTARGHAHFVRGESQQPPSLISRKRSSSIRIVRARSTGAASPTAAQAILSAPSRTTVQPSRSIPSMRSRTTTAATYTRAKARRTTRSQISKRRCYSIRR